MHLLAIVYSNWQRKYRREAKDKEIKYLKKTYHLRETAIGLFNIWKCNHDLMIKGKKICWIYVYPKTWPKKVRKSLWNKVEQNIIKSTS